MNRAAYFEIADEVVTNPAACFVIADGAVTNRAAGFADGAAMNRVDEHLSMHHADVKNPAACFEIAMNPAADSEIATAMNPAADSEIEIAMNRAALIHPVIVYLNHFLYFSLSFSSSIMVMIQMYDPYFSSCSWSTIYHPMLMAVHVVHVWMMMLYLMISMNCYYKNNAMIINHPFLHSQLYALPVLDGMVMIIMVVVIILFLMLLVILPTSCVKFLVMMQMVLVVYLVDLIVVFLVFWQHYNCMLVRTWINVQLNHSFLVVSYHDQIVVVVMVHQEWVLLEE